MTKLNNPNASRMNPCLKEQDQSYECLNKNGFDHKKCAAYFDNYNTCKKFWGKVYSDRKARGIYPYLPDVGERDKIKADYMKNALAPQGADGPREVKSIRAKYYKYKI